MKPLVSIVVPVYNRENYLHECINSLLKQKYQNIELLLIDDASTDSSPEICQKYSELDERVRFFPIEHRGVSGARNKGLDEAKGDYIMFCDSDDLVKETWVESFVNAMNDNVILAISGFEILETQERILNKDSVKKIDISLFLDYRKQWRMYSVWMCCFINTKVRFMTSISKGEDSLFVLEYINSMDHGELVYLPITPYKYRQNTNNSLFSFGKRDRQSYDATIDCLKQLKERWGCSDKIWNEEMSAIENEWFSEEVLNASYRYLKKLMQDERWNNYLNHLYGGWYEKIARLNNPVIIFGYLKYQKYNHRNTHKKRKVR